MCTRPLNFKIVFADSCKKEFAGFGLESFDDFFDYSDGKTINKNNKRDVIVLTLGDGAGSKTFFMKRFHNPHYKDMLSAWYKFGRPTSQAGVEWNNARLLLENGIDTYRPICFGEQKKWELEKKSFFVTEKLKSTEFVDFVSQKWLGLEQIEREKIIAGIAKLVRRAHNLDIILPDLCVWHIFIYEDCPDCQYQFSVIDLHRMAKNVQSRNKKIKDLGKFYWSMSDKYFDDKLKGLFLDAYMGDNWQSSKVAFIRKVQKRAAVITKRRKLKRY